MFDLTANRLGVRFPALYKLLVIGLLFAGAFGLGFGVPRFGWGLRELVIVITGLIGLLILLVPDDRIFMVALGIGVVTIAFGWRTFTVTPNLIIAPFEFIVWFLAAALFLKRLAQGERPKFHFSKPLMLFLLFSIPASVVAAINDIPLDVIIGYGKNIVMVFPFFFVIQDLVRDLETWKRVMFVTSGTVVYLSLTGLTLIVTPGLGRILIGILGIQVQSVDNFTRIGFAGWGPLAAWVFVLAFGIVLGLTDSTPNRWARLLYLGILGILGAGILVSGQRGAWIALLVGLVAYIVLNPGRGLMLSAFGGGLMFLLPQENFLFRFASAVDPTRFDNSAVDRYSRAGIALDALVHNPALGLGFGNMIFVHSDYLEIGAAMGLVALGLFLAALAVTGRRILKLQFSELDNSTKALMRGVLITFIILLVELLSAGFVSLPFTALIMWFFWAMCDQITVLVEAPVRVPDRAGSPAALIPTSGGEVRPSFVNDD